MAKPNKHLANALRATANNLSDGAKYEWGHMGRCNCGHLVQTITGLSDREIVKASENHMDEWTEHARDYCLPTGGSLDSIFETMKQHGFDYEDIINLEYLADRAVLQLLKAQDPEMAPLRHNQREDVVLYMRTMAELLEPSH